MIDLLHAATVITALWSAPTSRENGEPLPANDISSYNLYYAEDEVSPKSKLPIELSSSDLQAVVPSAPPQGCLYITTVDTNNYESKFSPAKCYNVPDRPTQTDIKIIITVQ